MPFGNVRFLRPFVFSFFIVLATVKSNRLMYVLAILLVHNDLFHTNEDVVGLPRLKQSANVIIWNNLMIISRVSGGSNV